ncbi:MAG TPA: hypothetical protein VFA18_02830 [Gemmataceae bacterium]|nr:hypothetical protein [Gemmataceae bacterium]
MKHYCYVLVRLDAMKCFTRVLAQSPANREPARWDEATLQRLLQDGWQPAREVTLGNGQALVLLERTAAAEES